MSLKAQRIRDPLHNIIEFGANDFEATLWKILGTRPFQRLRRVKQLGFSDFVYPGATHSRFMHSIGVFHTARMLMKVIDRELGGERKPQREQQALAAALVHDVGHGPFSHAFEDVGKRLNLKMANHELVSDAIIRQGEIADLFLDLGSGFAHYVADIINNGPGDIYSAVVSSQFDADRLDYVRRDRLMSGTNHGAIDFEWLIANLSIETIKVGVDDAPLKPIQTFSLGPKAFFAAEAYVLGLFQLYPTLYLHNTTRGIEKLYSELLILLFEAVRDDSWQRTGLPQTHPLIKFAQDHENVERLLDLDDTVIWGALSQLSESSIPGIAEASKRIRDRKCYKCIDIRVLAQPAFGNDVKGQAKLDEYCEEIEREIRAKNDEWSKNGSRRLPRILLDKSQRAPYKPMTESKGPLNQIRIQTLNDGVADLGAVSSVVSAISPFKVFRAYCSDNDQEARNFIRSLTSRDQVNVASH